MSAREGEASETIFQKVEKQLIKQVMLILHHRGRIMTYDDLGKLLLQNHSDLLERLLAEDRYYTLVTLAKRSSHIFYYLRNGEDYYVSLSRDYTYFIPRLAKALENVQDKRRETVLSYNGPETEVPPHYSKLSERFHEYSFAKSSLALLEIFNAVLKSIARDRCKVPLKRVTQRFGSLSGLAKSAMNFLTRGSDVIHDFLAQFEFFEISDSLLTVDYYLMDGFLMSLETDLILSYVGHCVCAGLSSIDDLLREIGELIQRARFLIIKEFTYPNLMELLQCRRKVFLVPGDGNVWMMDSCSNFDKQQLLEIKDFWARHLTKKPVHYTKCLDKFLGCIPEKAEMFEGESFLTMASYLYSLPKVFKFDKGMISLVRDESEVIDIPEMCPVDVPTNLNVYCRHVSKIRDDTDGYVKEVGIESCIISFEDDFVAENTIISLDDLNPLKADAFCDINLTLYKGEMIKDFTDILKKGDKVRFLYEHNAKQNVFFPLPTLVPIIGALNEDSLTKTSSESDFSEKAEASVCESQSRSQP